MNLHQSLPFNIEKLNKALTLKELVPYLEKPTILPIGSTLETLIQNVNPEGFRDILVVRNDGTYSYVSMGAVLEYYANNLPNVNLSIKIEDLAQPLPVFDKNFSYYLAMKHAKDAGLEAIGVKNNLGEVGILGGCSWYYYGIDIYSNHFPFSTYVCG